MLSSNDIIVLKELLNRITFLDDGDYGGLPFDPNEPTGKIGTKKMRKLEMKAEKKALREVCIIHVTF